MIALLCPSRMRAESCQRMVLSAIATTTEKVQIFIAVSPQEFDEYRATIIIPESDRFGVVIVTMPDNMPTVHKWNKLAELAMKDNKFFMLASDDMYFETKGWDKELKDDMQVYALQDSRDKDGTPHPIIGKEYIKAMGYFLPPWFLHWFCDSWTVEIAKYNNCFTHLKDFTLVHDKPSDRGKTDETHSRIREWGWHERDVWVDKHCRNTILVNEMQRLRSLIKK